MPRPVKLRNVCEMPRFERFGPAGGCPRSGNSIVEMSVEEYETIRLLDLEGFTQEECSFQMGIARTTVTAIYAEARRKIAEAIVMGKRLVIGGGNFRICEGNSDCCGKRGCSKRCEYRNTDKPCDKYNDLSADQKPEGE